jgi:hypothetical protein
MQRGLRLSGTLEARSGWGEVERGRGDGLDPSKVKELRPAEGDRPRASTTGVNGMWIRCEICGHRLGVASLVRNLIRRPAFDYPARLLSGRRTARRVRWICARCVARAERIGAEVPAPELQEQD